MNHNTIANHIVELLREAQVLALQGFGISNILQPGIIKELIMANVLGHQIIPQKDASDAKDKDGNMYEYLASINRSDVRTNKGGSFQIDRIVKNNLSRVSSVRLNQVRFV